jgi:tryptophan-rich sensory protein
VLFFGARQLTVPELTPRRVFIPMCLGIAVMAGAATYYLHAQGLDNSVGGRSAYIIQLSISFLYVPLMLRQPTLEYFSFNANWLRAAGSALVVVFFFLHFPQDTFLLTIGCAAAVVDAVFLYLFVQKRRRLAAGAPVIRNAVPA